MEIIAEPIGAVEVKVLTNQTSTCQARYMTKEFSFRQEYLGDKC